MDLDKQIQLLINDAPQDGVTPGVVAAIGPARQAARVDVLAAVASE